MSSRPRYLRHARLSTLRIFSLFFLFCSFFSTGQVTIFSENFGSGSIGPISTYSSTFQNSVCLFQFTGTGSVSTTSPSNNYSFASGARNIFLNAGESITISGINTLEYSQANLRYGLSINNVAIPSFGPGFSIECSTDGTNYSTLTRSPALFTLLTQWENESVNNLPLSSNLWLRFTNNSSSLDFRLDDVQLLGTISLTQPSPYSGWPAQFSFATWPSTSTAGTYPSNMIFHYGAINTSNPPFTSSSGTQNYAFGYNKTCGTRINGLGSSGISFLNETPGHSTTSTGNLGEAVLSLNTTCRGSITVQWIAGSITPTTNNVYSLRAQYRVGTTGAFTDLPGLTANIEYSSNSPSTSVTFSPIVLPAVCENTTDVQVRWIYYHTSGSGTPSEIFLDDIVVTSQPYPVVSPFAKPTICGGDTMPPLVINPTQATFTWANPNPTLIPSATSGGSPFPGFIAPVLSDTLDHPATIVYTVSFGSCSYSSSLTTVVKGQKEKTTWDGSRSTNWFIHDNWSNCVCHEGAEGKIASGLHPARIPYGVGKAKTLIVANNGAIIVDPGGTLEIKENFQNDEVTVLAGKVLLSGTVTQIISGSKPTFFSDLEVTNPTTVSLQDSVYIVGTLKMSAGTFSTGGLLRLISNTSATGRIGPIASGANITGAVTIERLAPGGATGWAQFGAPITASNTFAQWDDDFVITCTNCPDGYFNFTSIYSYNEPAVAASYSDAAKYVPINNITDPTALGTGYWVYFGNGNQTSTDMKFSVTGPVATSGVTIAVSNSSVSNQTNYGWNLISNPLPSAISFTTLRNGNASIDNSYYVYNADENAGQGGYSSYINGVGSSTLVSMTDEIAMCQGFYVHASASTSLVATELCKVAADPHFLKGQPTLAKPIFRISQSSGKHADLCTFYFEPGATKHFQTDYDAYKLNFDPGNIPYIGSMADSILASINGLPPLSSNITVDVKAITPVTGTFSFSGLKSDFPYDVCVTLKDKYTGTITDLLTQSYTCTLYDTTATARFQVSFYSKPLNGSGNTSQPDCKDPNGGYLTAYVNSSGPWNYEWSSNGTVIKTSLATSYADTLFASGSGVYSVKINTDGQCDRYQKNFYINHVEPTIASFSSDIDTAYISNGATVNFINKSLGHVSSQWVFGDGQVLFTHNDPAHSYSSPGNYQVELITESATGCKDTAENTLVVLDDVTGDSKHVPGQEIILSYDHGDGNYSLLFNFNNTTAVEMELLDQRGGILRNEKWGAVKKEKKVLNLSSLSEGVYLLRLKINDGEPMVFKLIR